MGFDTIQAACREALTGLPGVCEEIIGYLPGGEILAPLLGLCNICIDPLVKICGGALLF